MAQHLDIDKFRRHADPRTHNGHACGRHLHLFINSALCGSNFPREVRGAKALEFFIFAFLLDGTSQKNWYATFFSSSNKLIMIIVIVILIVIIIIMIKITVIIITNCSLCRN